MTKSLVTILRLFTYGVVTKFFCHKIVIILSQGCDECKSNKRNVAKSYKKCDEMFSHKYCYGIETRSRPYWTQFHGLHTVAQGDQEFVIISSQLNLLPG